MSNLEIEQAKFKQRQKLILLGWIALIVFILFTFIMYSKLSSINDSLRSMDMNLQLIKLKLSN